MILKTELFQNVCSSILSAVDSNELATLTETLELKTEGKILWLNVTNGEYYVRHLFDLDHEEEFHATVNANLFSKLIANTTKPEIELILKEKVLQIKANGDYKLPLIMNADENSLLELPQITIENKTVEMPIAYDILESIANFNSKEIATSSLAKPVQRMYYVDQEGCITFTPSTACVNSFQLAKPISILLNNRIVKLFKLFKGSGEVNFELGYDALSETLVQPKVKFSNDKISLTAILSSNDLLVSVPKDKIRANANKEYPNKVVLNKDELLEAVNRLMLFNNVKLDARPFGVFNFSVTGQLTIFDKTGQNSEVINYQAGSELEGDYILKTDFSEFKRVLENCPDAIITLSYGDSRSSVISRAGIKNVIAEVRKVEEKKPVEGQSQ